MAIISSFIRKSDLASQVRNSIYQRRKWWASKNRKTQSLISRFDDEYPIGFNHENIDSRNLFTNGIIKVDQNSVDENLANQLVRIVDAHGVDQKNMRTVDLCNYPVFVEYPRLLRILTDRKLIFLASSYLGTALRLDKVSLSLARANSKEKLAVSGAWHADHSGHHLKIFIYLNKPKQWATIPTQYALGTNRRRYKFGVFDQRGVNTVETIANADTIAKKKSWNVLTVSGTLGEATLFDVNGYHRGVYYGNEVEDRYVLLLEYANRFKENNLGTLSQAASGRVRLPLNIDSTAALIDRDMLRKVGNSFIYEMTDAWKKHDPTRK
jgi:hypothetical protein